MGSLLITGTYLSSILYTGHYLGKCVHSHILWSDQIPMQQSYEIWNKIFITTNQIEPFLLYFNYLG